MDFLFKNRKYLIIVAFVIIIIVMFYIFYDIQENTYNNNIEDASRLSKIYSDNKRNDGVNNIPRNENNNNSSLVDNNTEIKNVDEQTEPLEKEESSDNNSNDVEFADISNEEVNEKKVEKFMLQISDMINKKDFQGIINLFNKNYLDEFKLTNEEIIDMFTFDNEVEPILCSVKKAPYEKSIFATVRFKDVYDWEKMYHFTLFEDGTIANIPLSEERTYKEVAKKDDITYQVTKSYTTRLGSIYFLKIRNDSEYVLNVKNIKGNWSDNVYYNYENLTYKQSSFELLPGIDREIIIKIPYVSMVGNLIVVRDNNGIEEEFSIFGSKIVKEE